MQKLNRLLTDNPYWQQGKAWYAMRSARDQKALLVLIGALLVFGIYFLVWEPLAQWSENSKQDYLYQQSVNTWLHGELPKARTMQQSHKTTHQDLSALVVSQAQRTGITLGKVQPDRKGLSVWIEDAAYQKLLKWLVLLHNQQGVAIEQLRLEQLPDKGRVKSYIRLSN